jgi:glycerate dehydrogenase
MKIAVLDGYCTNPGDLSWDALRTLGDLEVFDRTRAEEAVRRAAGAEIVLLNKTPLPAEALEQLPQLRYIGVLATGYNVVDIEAARRLGIVVTNVPTYGTASVAQFVFALLLELCHRVGLHAEAVRAGEWSRNPDWSFWKAPLVELAGKTIGIVGFGRIGRQTGKIADAMGMRVIANDTYRGDPPPYEGFRWAGDRGAAPGVRRGEPALAAASRDRGAHRRGAARVDEAVGVSDQHIARAANRRPGSRRCAERGADRGRRAGRAVDRAPGGGQSAAFGAQLSGDAAHRLGDTRSAVPAVGSGGGERNRVHSGNASQCGKLRPKYR